MKRFLALILIALLFPSAAAWAQTEASDELTMYFFDQSDKLLPIFLHGDCTLIVFPNGQTMLVDCGVPVMGRHVKDWLLAHDVQHIDWFVASHLHQDHVGAFPFLYRDGAITFDHILQSGIDKATLDTCFEYVRTLRKADNTVRQVRAGDRLTVGDVQIDFLWPLPDAADITADTAQEAGRLMNIQSLVFRLTYGGFSMLFTGDIHIESELELMRRYDEELQADVLKLAHHGLQTSNCPRWIDTVKPQAAVCMGRTLYNDRMPSLLAKRGISFWGTWMDGDITLSTNGAEMTIQNAEGCITAPV